MPSRRGWYLLVVSLLIPLFTLTGCGKTNKSYSVSGRITEYATHKGIADVTITATPGHTIAKSDANGNWTLTDLSGPVSIKPTKGEWSFTPTEKQVTKAVSNVTFEGTNNTYKLSGRVLSYNGSSLSGVVVSFNQGFGETTTDVNGNWSKDGLFGTVLVSATKDGWIFGGSVGASEARSDFNFTGLYIISGKIATVSGKTTDSISLTIGDDTRTINGEWAYYGLNKAVTITPNKDGYKFDPPSRNVTGPNSAVDFVLLPQNYTVNGTIAEEGTNKGIAGVTLTFSNGYGTTTTDTNGHWVKSGLSNYITVTPNKIGWTFDPPSRQVAESDLSVLFSGIGPEQQLTELTNLFASSLNGKSEAQLRSMVSNDYQTRITTVDGDSIQMGITDTIDTFMNQSISSHLWYFSQLSYEYISATAYTASGTFRVDTNITQDGYIAQRTEKGNVKFSYTKSNGVWKIMRMAITPIMPSASNPPVLTLVSQVTPSGPYHTGTTARFVYGYQNAGGPAFTKIEYKLITPQGNMANGSNRGYVSSNGYDLGAGSYASSLPVPGKYRMELKLSFSYNDIDYFVDDDKVVEITVQ